MSKPEASKPPSPYAWYVLAMMFLVTALNVADRNILQVLLQPIKEEFEVSDTAMGLLVGTGFAVVHIFASLLIARWADRGVRRSIIAGGLLVWSGLTLLSGLTRSYWQLLVARVGVSAAEGAGSAPAHSLLCDYFPLDMRARAMAIFGMGGIAGMGLGLALGGTIAEFYGWRSAFFVLGLPGVLLAVAVRLGVREPKRGSMDETVAPETAPPTREVLRFLLGRRSFVHMVLGAGYHAFAGMGAGAFNIAYLMRIHGMTIGEASRIFVLVGPLLGAISAFGGGYLADALGRRDVRWYMWIPAFSALLALPFSVAFVLWPAGSTIVLGEQVLPLALIVIIPASLLGGMWNGPTLAMTQSIAPPHMRSFASALTTGTYNLIGMGLGPLAVGIISDALHPRLGADAIRYGLLVVGLTHLLGAMHHMFAARHLVRDLGHLE